MDVYFISRVIFGPYDAVEFLCVLRLAIVKVVVIEKVKRREKMSKEVIDEDM